MPEETDLQRAVLAELGRRTDVCWVRVGAVTQAVWHAWVEADGVGALAVVSGGEEQPFPEVADGGRVEVVMRSKDTGGRVLVWDGLARVVRPGDAWWEPSVAALVARRLNLRDPDTVPGRWAEGSVVRRIVPVD